VQQKFNKERRDAMSADFGRPQGMVTSVMAIVALVLGAAALYFGVSASKMKVELNERIAALQQDLATASQQAQGAALQVRQLDGKTEGVLIAIGTKLRAIEAKLAPPPPAPVTAGAVAPAAPGAAAAGAAGSYAIQSGDTPEKIAKKFKTTADALLKANPGLDARRMKVGAKIKVPAAAPAAAER
jgi:LysM repeat protein